MIADDSSFEGTGKTRDEAEEFINGELEKVALWFKKNRLTLHPDKSRSIVHSRDKLINLKLNNINIQRCGYGLQEESVKLLGIHIDEKLDWGIHIKSVEKKVSKGNYLLWRYNKILNISSKKAIYESFVRSHLLYGLNVWGGAATNKLADLNKILQKVWKKFGTRFMHTKKRLNSYDLLYLKDEVEIQESKLLWKWENKLLPKSIQSIIEEKNDRLRGRRFNITRNMKDSSIRSRLTKRANSSVSVIANNKSLKVLSNKLRKDKLASYDVPCRVRNCFACNQH